MSRQSLQSRREYRECQFFLNTRPMLWIEKLERQDSLEDQILNDLAIEAGLLCATRRSDGVYLSFLSVEGAIRAFEKMKQLDGFTVRHLVDEEPGKWPEQERFEHPRPPSDRLFFRKGIDLTKPDEFDPDPVMHPVWHHNLDWYDHVSRCPCPDAGFAVRDSVLAELEILVREETDPAQGV